MSALRDVARPMLASIFVAQGMQTFQDPQRVAMLAEPIVGPLKQRVPAVSGDTEQVVRINGAVQAAAGTLLGLGVLPRLAALAIAGTLVPTTIAGHRFWEIQDPKERGMQRIHFLKNVTMMGGLLLAIADTGGNPSLSWRRRHAKKVLNGYVAGLTHAVSDVSNQVAHATRVAATAGAR